MICPHEGGSHGARYAINTQPILAVGGGGGGSVSLLENHSEKPTSGLLVAPQGAACSWLRTFALAAYSTAVSHSTLPASFRVFLGCLSPSPFPRYHPIITLQPLPMLYFLLITYQL